MGFYERHLRPRLVNAAMDTKGSREIRDRVCAGLFGEVIEIGYGSGLNQSKLPATVRSVAAIEPSPLAWQLSAPRRADSNISVALAGRDAQDLPFPNDTFDCALSTWTLCAIADPPAALREIRRVLKPGGVLHFVEHGLAPDASVVRWQRRASGLNKRIAGCVLDRDVPALLEKSGLDVTEQTSFYDEESPKPAGYHYEGRAVA